MTSNVIPVSYNENVLPIKQTTPNPFELKGDFNELGYSLFNKIEGFVFPTDQGRYPILDTNQNQVSLPTSCFLNLIGFISVGSEPSTLTYLKVITSMSDVLYETRRADIVAGHLAAPDITRFSSQNNPGKLSVSTTGASPPNTCIKIVFYYMVFDEILMDDDIDIDSDDEEQE